MMRIWVNSPFISRKTAICWPVAGMTRERHQNWIHALEESVRDNRGYGDWLKQALEEGRRLRLTVSIFGIPQRIKQLDVHDALSQIIDETTDCLFPREKGRTSPQTQDRHFWKVGAQKFVDRPERVEIEVEELKREVQVFKKFARVCPYQLDLDSITSPDPPDIVCNLLDGTTMSFEVVQCLDESIARSMSDSLNLPKVFYHELRHLPQESRERINKKFGDASIYVSFLSKISKGKKESSVRAILDRLLTLEITEDGEFDLTLSRDLRKVLRRVRIKRWKGVTRPIFSVGSATSFGEPAKERIKEKFKKKYKTEPEIELLAYYDSQPEIPENNWLPSVRKFVERNIEGSAFRRVWIYSTTHDRIIFVHPDA